MNNSRNARNSIANFVNFTLDDDLSEVGVTGALLAVPNDDELLPKLPLP